MRISNSNAWYTMFWGSGKSTGYPLHSPVSSSLPLPCVTVCHHISTGPYHRFKQPVPLSTYYKAINLPQLQIPPSPTYSYYALWIILSMYTPQNCYMKYFQLFIKRFRIWENLDTFAQFWRGTVSFVTSACPYVYMEQFGFCWTDFCEVLNLRIFREFVEKIQVSLKPKKKAYLHLW
jgi:hypothetical protein